MDHEPRDSASDARRPPAPPPRGDRPHLIHLMMLVAGLAVGIWLVLPDLRTAPEPVMGNLSDHILLVATALLGGLAVVGPPILLARRARRAWGAGRLLWFSTGTSAWLLWPPIVWKRLDGGQFGDAGTGVCFAYGTPLMAVYVTAALLFGGHLRRARRRRLRRSWQETFGLLLGLAWACTGLYVLSTLYRGNR